MWVLNDRPSIRFVRDALLMRRAGTIELVLSRAAAPSLPVSTPVEPGTSSDSTSGGALGGEYPVPQCILFKCSQVYYIRSERILVRMIGCMSVVT